MNQDWESRLFSISNTEIALAALACFGAMIAIRRWGRLRSLQPRTSGVYLLVFVQIALLVLMPAYRNTVIIYLFLFVVGASLHAWMTPSFLRQRFSWLAIIPLYGLIVVSVVGSYFIAFDVAIALLAPGLIILSLLCFLIQYRINRQKLTAAFQWPELKSSYRGGLFTYTCVITPVILCMIIPVVMPGLPSSPFRLGPDMALYAKTAQFFLDGGTWTEAGLRATELANMTPGEITLYADATLTWPEMYYFRWGLTAYQASASIVTFASHTYETQFISMVIPYLLAGGLVFVWLNGFGGLSPAVSGLGAIAFVFNANLINLWFEGFYGNAFVLVFFVYVLLIFINQREKNLSRTEFIRSTSTLSLLFAATLFSYPEAVAFIFVVYAGFIFLADLGYNRTIKWSSYGSLFVGGVVGILIVLPCGFLIKWLLLAFNLLTVQGGNGYQQPLWSLPGEILGFESIYLNTSVALIGQLLVRSVADNVLVYVTSCLALFVSIRYLIRVKRPGNAIYIASMAMVIFSAVYVSYRLPQNNYTYMKMYVFHLPFLFLLFWNSLTSPGLDATKNSARALNYAMMLAFSFIFINGLLYIIQYRQEEMVVEKNRIALHKDLATTDFKNVILYPVFRGQGHLIRDILHRNAYPAVLPLPWIIPGHWVGKPYFEKFRDDKVYLFVEKRPRRVYHYKQENLVFENPSFLIVDSGMKISDALQTPQGPLNLDVFNDLVSVELDADQQAHNKEVGLPLDFDPATYLEINPGLVEFWKSHGIHESGEVLLNHAEEHYKAFGSKDGWKYR
jgi:hypothetical protein